MVIIVLIIPLVSGDFDTESVESEGADSYEICVKPGALRMDLTGQLRKTMVYHVAMSTKESTVCSPLSALMPLGKLMMGSSSRNNLELKEATGYRRSKVEEKFYKVRERILNISSSVQLSLASRLYVSNKNTLNSAFDEKVRAVFKSSCETVDFGNPQKTAAVINEWVSSQTKGMITDLINPSMIQKSTSLIITNAIYFHGTWSSPFESMKKANFYAPGQNMEVDMMTVTDYFKYVKDDKHGVEIIQMDYLGNDVSFVIILPCKNRNIDNFLKKALKNPNAWNTLFRTMVKRRLLLSVPKFKTTTKLDLNAIYKKVGLNDIFKMDNNILTKLIKNQKAYVSSSVHAAVIEVDMQGTTAAAATAMEVALLSGHLTPPTPITVDRPFLYFVMANTEQLFAGFYTGL